MDYSNAAYRKHLELVNNEMPSYPERNKIVKDFVSASLPSGKVLELGCGEFPLFDNSDRGDVVNVSKPRYFQVDCNKKMPFEDQSYDAIIALELIEHLYDTDRFLKECNRLLVNDGNGYVIFSTPNVKYWKNRIGLLLGNDSYFEHSFDVHIQHFSPQSLSRYLSKYGFQTVLLKKYGRTPLLNFAGGFLIVGKKIR